MTHTKVVVCLDTRQIYSQAFPKTKNTWTEYGLNALNMFFSPLFLISVMAPKRCFVWTHTHTLHQHTAPSSSLLTLHHHANPACFTRQETEKLIVIPQGSADLSQICLRSPPHFTSFQTCFGFQGSKKNLSSQASTANARNLWAKPCPWGIPHPRCEGIQEGMLNKRWRGRQSEDVSFLPRAPRGYKARVVPILKNEKMPNYALFVFVVVVYYLFVVFLNL